MITRSARASRLSKSQTDKILQNSDYPPAPEFIGDTESSLLEGEAMMDDRKA
jgi:hypothetical protein